MTYNAHQAPAQMSPHGMNQAGPPAAPPGAYAPRAQAPRQGSAGNMALWGVLAAIALLACGVFASEALKHNAYVERRLAEATAMQEQLKVFPFDANGNVAPRDRMKFEMLMSESKSLPRHIGEMKGVRDQEVLVALGALVFAAGAGFLAWRNRPRPATA